MIKNNSENKNGLGVNPEKTKENASTCYEAVKDHLSCELNGESVILSMETGMYHGVNSVGSYIWSLVQGPASLDDIISALVNEFEVDEEVCRQEVVAFLEKMKEKELIKVSNV